VAKKMIVITGGTSGIGLACVHDLLSKGWEICLLARGREKVEMLQKRTGGNLHYVYCDLADLRSVKHAADQLKAELSHIDVLMNNAGAWFMKKQFTKDDFEMSFGMNHLGHFLLTTELMDILLKSKSRIINVSSGAHKSGEIDFEDMRWEKRKYEVFKSYGASKLANILFTKELKKRYGDQGLTAYSLHPGVVGTNFGNTTKGPFSWLYSFAKPFMITPKTGAKTQLMLATEEGIEKYSGEYFVREKVKMPAIQALDMNKANELWKYSEICVAPF
jgi:NAD(P)-dependent dehydrogenase (short-subunit alcohol dehydrogenase family)